VNLVVVIGVAAARDRSPAGMGFAKAGRNPSILASVVQRGKPAFPQRRRRMQHFPPGGRFYRGKALALDPLLGFNLNKIG
jgi:hypothetical protein